MCKHKLRFIFLYIFFIFLNVKIFRQKRVYSLSNIKVQLYVLSYFHCHPNVMQLNYN